MRPEDVQAEITTCAQSLRATATGSSNYLGTPIECPALGSASAFTPVLAWALFNPFGPTMSAIHLVEVPNTKERIIFFRWLNPFATGATAYGLVPDAVAHDPKRLLGVLMPVFERRIGEPAPVMPSLPTHVQILPESPLESGQVRELVLAAGKGSDSKALNTTMQRLRMYKGDPWKRTAVERDEAFERLGKGAPRPPDSPPVPATRAQLEEWWALVTDPVHVQSEVRELPRAWEGAIEFQKRMRPPK
jgi:hypothetical protein